MESLLVESLLIAIVLLVDLLVAAEIIALILGVPGPRKRRLTLGLSMVLIGLCAPTVAILARPPDSFLLWTAALVVLMASPPLLALLYAPRIADWILALSWLLLVDLPITFLLIEIASE